MISRKIICSTSVIFMLAVTATAQPLAWENPRQEILYNELLRELRCLVCANQSLQDSNAGLAKDLRGKTRELILAGKTRAEIINYMVQRYGEYVRYRPGFHATTYLLWLAPFGVVLIGLLICIARVARRNKTTTL